MNADALQTAGFHGEAVRALLGTSQQASITVAATRPSNVAERSAGLVVITNPTLYVGTLEADITDSATAANFLGLSAGVAPEYFLIDNECVLAIAQPTAGVPKTVTIRRAGFGSAAAAHTAGAVVKEMWQFILPRSNERDDLVDGDTLMVVNTSASPGLVRVPQGAAAGTNGYYLPEAAAAEYVWYARRHPNPAANARGQWYRLNVRENGYF